MNETRDFPAIPSGESITDTAIDNLHVYVEHSTALYIEFLAQP